MNSLRNVCTLGSGEYRGHSPLASRKTAAFWSPFGGAAVIRCWSNADESPVGFGKKKFEYCHKNDTNEMIVT